MAPRNLPQKIDDLIALGTAVLGEGEAANLIPVGVARELARRWLFEQARDQERAAVREVEQASTLVDRGQRVRDEAERDARKRRFRGFAESLEPLRLTVYDATKPWVNLVYHDDQIDWAHRDTWEAMEAFEGGDSARAAAILEARARQRQANVNARREEEQRLWREAVDGLIEERAVDAGMEWTAALLTSTVAMPDGTRVPWGEATIEQHAARLNALAQHASTELATATRHRAAIEAIRNVPGARCLNDVASTAAA